MSTGSWTQREEEKKADERELRALKQREETRKATEAISERKRAAELVKHLSSWHLLNLPTPRLNAN